jgi:diaminopimelate decarboxylase
MAKKPDVTLAAKPALLDFGHPPETIQFWKRLVHETLSLSPVTPFYLFSALPIAEKISELDAALINAGFQSAIGNHKSKISCRHWLSCKTQPVAPLLRWWREQGRGIEVVSEFELRAALAEGYAPENILVNGPAKHHWLPQLVGQASRLFGVEGVSAKIQASKGETPSPQTGGTPVPLLRNLSVNFDSPAELAALLPLAKKLNWRCGVRILTNEEFDPESPEFPTQFGFLPDEAVAALKKLRRAKVWTENVHFHLRSNVSAVAVFERAIAEVAEVCRAAKFSPLHLDIGGGIPVRQVLTRGSKVYDGEFGLRSFAKMLRQSAKQFLELREIWLENGRFLTTSSGALVVKILDVKERRGVRQLICDGGRTLNALMSLWEQHALLPLTERADETALTVVHGPTCMAFDQLARIPLPRSLQAGDHLIWLEAGAYHLPWEARFSHGHAAVWWHDERGLRLARERQNFQNFWGQWE